MRCVDPEAFALEVLGVIQRAESSDERKVSIPLTRFPANIAWFIFPPFSFRVTYSLSSDSLEPLRFSQLGLIVDWVHLYTA